MRLFFCVSVLGAESEVSAGKRQLALTQLGRFLPISLLRGLLRNTSANLLRVTGFDVKEEKTASVERETDS